MAVRIRNRKVQRDRFIRRSVIKPNHNPMTICCGDTNDWCYGKITSRGRKKEFKQKTNFNGFDTGMYEAAIINTSSDSSSRGTSGGHPYVKRSSLYDRVPITTTANGGNRGDFMSNLTPQWPEPEPEPLLPEDDLK